MGDALGEQVPSALDPRSSKDFGLESPTENPDSMAATQTYFAHPHFAYFAIKVFI
jgi:hypothetical protein